MTLDTVNSIVQIISISVLLPLAAFKAWRKLDERMTEQDKRLIRIEYQLYENGGGSMKDQMNATRKDLTDLKTDFLVFKAKEESQ